MLKAIFDLFMQVDHSLDRSQGGLGIGLTLVRSLVQMHGGEVEAFSPGANQGSEFVVTLPRLAANEAEPTADRRFEQADIPQSCRVLVVDDNIDSAHSLAMLLQLRGHCTAMAHSGPAALDQAEQFRPDLVLLDIGLPGMDGYEVARRLRRHPELRRTVIAALTGYGRAEDMKLSREAGFDHHLVKPVDLRRLDALFASLAMAAST
jgi:two-component system CheB/CheR fusion protein